MTDFFDALSNLSWMSQKFANFKPSWEKVAAVVVDNVFVPDVVVVDVVGRNMLL